MKLFNSLRFYLIIFAVSIIFSLGARANAISSSAPNNTLAEKKTSSSDAFLPVIKKSVTPIIPNTTNILSENTTQYLDSISSDGSFTFTQTTSELDEVNIGEIIVAGTNHAAPAGFLRRVVSMNAVRGRPGHVELHTINATLEEAIEQGAVHHSRVLTTGDIETSKIVDGVSLQRAGADALKRLV